MSLDLIVTLFLITTVATMLPGPTMLYIASCGLSHGTKGYLAAGCGVLVADAIYFILTITGLSVILITSYELFSLVKWLGVAYLIYLGFKIIVSNKTITFTENDLADNAQTIRRIFLKGFLIHLANPKTILFFSALLPQFVNSDNPILFQILLVGAVLFFTQAAASILYGSMANSIRVYVKTSGSSQKLNIISGFILIVAGLWLATVSRSKIV